MHILKIADILKAKLNENADQEVNVSEKTDICPQTILVQT